MASITFRKSTKYGTEPYAVLTVSGGSQDEANNQTLVSYSLDLYRPSKVISSTNKSYSITINGTTVKSGTYSIGGKGNKNIANGSVYVKHNSDGTKLLSYGGSVEFGVTWSGTALGTISNSGTVSLNPLNVSATVSVLTIFTNIKYFADGISQYKVDSMPKSTGVVDSVVLTMGSYSQVLPLGNYFTIPVDWCNGIPSDSDNETATVTLTTTKNDGTIVGSTSIDIPIYIPEYVGKPDRPIGHVSSKTELTATIDLTRPVFKYGATFARWDVSSNIGEVEVTGDNTITFTRETDDNITVVAYIRAVDSRGFMSDMISIPCYVRKRGFCVYDGIWRQASPYVYINGQYVRRHGSVHNNSWADYRYRGIEFTYLLDESNNIMTDESGIILRL